MKIKKTLIAFTLLFLYTKSTYAFSYNILIPNNYEFTGKDYLGENIQAHSNQGYIFSLVHGLSKLPMESMQKELQLALHQQPVPSELLVIDQIKILLYFLFFVKAYINKNQHRYFE